MSQRRADDKRTVIVVALFAQSNASIQLGRRNVIFIYIIYIYIDFCVYSIRVFAFSGVSLVLHKCKL